MSRPITFKRIQIHQECTCGHNTVDQQTVQMRFADLKAAGIRCKRDKTTGKPFFTQHYKVLCQGPGHSFDH